VLPPPPEGEELGSVSVDIERELDLVIGQVMLRNPVCQAASMDIDVETFCRYFVVNDSLFSLKRFVRPICSTYRNGLVVVGWEQ